MARLTPEQLAQLRLIKEALAEMRDEVDDMPGGEVWEIETWMHYLRVKILVVLARHGLEIEDDPPAPLLDDMPF